MLFWYLSHPQATSSEKKGSGEPSQVHRLTRDFAAHIVWM